MNLQLERDRFYRMKSGETCKVLGFTSSGHVVFMSYEGEVTREDLPAEVEEMDARHFAENIVHEVESLRR